MEMGFKFQLLTRMKGFIGEFEKLQKVTIMSFVMFVCPSARNATPAGRILTILDI
jgi:hypothetical protein